ncbi:MAG TPA: GyrI-like domain-containing protein [Thermoplasmata archaeon]|nr:GyrI-like domain-containing protein [Thermoplasmata archaeon]
MRASTTLSITVKHMDSFRVAYVTHRGPWADVGIAFRELANRLWARQVRPTGPYLALHGRPPSRPTSRSPIAAAAQVALATRPREGLDLMDVPASEVAAVIFDGPASRLGEAFQVLARWIRDHGYIPTGPFREIHVPDLSSLPPGIVHAELQVPVREARRKGSTA